MKDDRKSPTNSPEPDVTRRHTLALAAAVATFGAAFGIRGAGAEEKKADDKKDDKKSDRKGGDIFLKKDSAKKDDKDDNKGANESASKFPQSR